MDESYNYLNEEPAIIIDQQQGHISTPDQHQLQGHHLQPEHHHQESHQPEQQSRNHDQRLDQQPQNDSNGDQQQQQQQQQPPQPPQEAEEDAMGDGIFGNVTQGLEGNYRNMLMAYWQETIDSIEHDEHDFKNHQLPLARIKKVMKTDEEVRMISAEAPILFAKGCDIFITELTMRAWIHAEENKRRTLQKSDIAAALQKSDMFDFLIDIVPREDDKPQQKRQHSTSSRQNSLNFNLNGNNTPVTTTNLNGDNIAQSSRSTENITSAESLANQPGNGGEFIEENVNVNNVPNQYQYNELTNYEDRY